VQTLGKDTEQRGWVIGKSSDVDKSPWTLDGIRQIVDVPRP